VNIIKNSFLEKKRLKIKNYSPFKNKTKFNLDNYIDIWRKKPIFYNNGYVVQSINTIRKNGVPVAKIGLAFNKKDFISDFKFIFFSLVYFPKPIHQKIFSEHSRYLAPFGPAEEFLGSVGSIKAGIWNRNQKRFLRVQHIQSHFRSGVGDVSRSLSTLYGGWRERLLSELFKIAEKEKVKIISYSDVDPKSVKKYLSKAVLNRREAFIKMAINNGFKIHQSLDLTGTNQINLTFKKIE
jgi:hypothetical protein